MSSIIDEPAHDERAIHDERTLNDDAIDERLAQGLGLPPIGLWWPMLERSLQREVLENLDAPLRPYVVRRVYDLCDRDGEAIPRSSVRLGVNERAYIAGWMHAVDWH